MKRLLLILIIFFIKALVAYSQVDIYDKFLEPNSKRELSLDISSMAFFDNIEFYNNIQRGYTLPGFYFEPRLVYFLTSKAKISGGLHALYFAGENSFSKVIPLLSLQTELLQSVSLTIGSIDAENNHGLPVQLFKQERAYLNRPETGVQILFNTENFIADTWINWENFIVPGDTVQEEFTSGFSAKLKDIQVGSVGLDIPIHAVAVHKGGQINESNESVSTLANFASGLNFYYQFNSGNRFGTEFLGYLGRDLSPNPHHIFKKGWAINPIVYFKTPVISVDAGYWKASELILPRGEEIFGSLSMVDPIHNEPQRELLISKLAINKEVANGFMLAFGGQFYYDLRSPMLDYRFYVSISFNESFSILNR